MLNRVRPLSLEMIRRLASAISVMEIATAVRHGRLALNVPLEKWLADAGVTSLSD